jgi:hypothetical protein
MTAPNLNGKDFAIGILSVTAVILFTAVVILQNISPRPAMAVGQGGYSGDYVVSTARLDDTTEVVYVIDTAAQQMNMYGFNFTRGFIELVQAFDMRALDAMNQRPPERGPGERPPRRGR